jgi:galactokinase
MVTFQQFFGDSATVEESAPGRVNLLGEHTDYNDGFVLPIGIPMHTRVALAPSRDDAFHFYSDQLDEHVLLARRGHLGAGYGRYIEGCVRMLERHGYDVPPLRVYVRSTVPMGAGLSSSAALEVATLRALRALFALRLDDVEIAVLAQKAEVAFAGVHCGIMDQMASSLCDEVHMLFLDTRSLRSELLDLPPGSEVLVIDSGVPRTLGATRYNERRAECATAARALGVTALRDLLSVEPLDKVDEPFRRRARHVITENRRVMRATQRISAQEFGLLMNESHDSLRDDFEVSIVELDILCDLLRATPGVYGARLTGAGFGGACVALCEAGAAASVGESVLARYNAGGRAGRVLIPAADQPGARHD